MDQTKNHFPQVIQEVYETLELFPNLKFTQLRELFTTNYQNQEVVTTKHFQNSLRFGYWKFHNFEGNLSYS